MGLLRKKTDVTSERAQELSRRIAELESQISKLSKDAKRPSPSPAPAKKPAASTAPRWRSTSIPHQANSAGLATPPEPVIDEIDQRRGKLTAEKHAPEHLNDLGVRKYDLAGAWERFKANFAGPTTSNPKLVSYLAAGSVQGLRPLRYEKRVARNRFMVLIAMLVFLMWGILAIVVGRR